NIIDSNGTIKVSYEYDAWGKVINIDGDEDLIEINSYLYKGYYYDKETQLFYCNFRYYDSEIRRWISIDDVNYLDSKTINGVNLYAYCMNNPVMCSDPSGHLPKWAKWLIGGVAFAGAVALTALTGGALAPVFINMGVSIVSGALIQGTINAIQGNDFWQGAADGAADGAMWGGIFSLVSAGIGAIKYTRGFRVVGLNEYDDIARTGKFASNGFSEGKYFWSSKSSARTFVSEMGMADDTYRIIGSRISRSGLKNALSNGTAHYFPYLDEIGRAYFIDIDIVNQLVSKIWTVF
ncbi:MAG: RHS repeat-associated core domain-containing protein, partial [Bacilli bacterium]|nr:RHS repeat-associated core domain-containing protein [Bacilli bacterium]